MSDSIPLPRVFDALQADAYRAYRVAMWRSRGGTVLLKDLLAGLAEVAPETLSNGMGLDAEQVAELALPPASPPDLVPMANEDALRSVLLLADQIANGGTISTEALIEAVRRQDPWHPRNRLPSPTFEWTGKTALPYLERWLAAHRSPTAERDVKLAGLVPGAAKTHRDHS